MDLREIFNATVAIMESRRGSATSRRDEAVEALISRGFVKVGCGGTSVALAHDAFGGIVVKVSALGVDYPNLQKHPPLVKIWLKPLFATHKVCIQPRVDTSRGHEAMNTILSILSKRRDGHFIPYDLHHRNVGFWRGRAVAFDMMAY